MQVFKIGSYTINAWAELLAEGGWQGMATISPPIPDTWTGGPEGRSLVTDGIRVTERAAESHALDAALAALRRHDPSA